MSTIKFGTDGWRAVIARDFTFAGCRVVTQGIASFINSQKLGRKGIIVGYDNRFMSRDFAEEVARVLVGNGIKVYMFKKACPTPLAAFAIRYKEAGGAVMITASHNPPEYNGIKYIPDYAGPAMPETTSSIEAEIERVMQGCKIYELNLTEAAQLDLFQEIDLDGEYIKHLLKLIQVDSFTGKKLKVVVDPMYGSGMGYLDKILTELGCEVKAIHNYRDVLFGGSMPEPVDSNLTELKRAVLSYNASIGLAMDGDADRFGIIDNQGRFINGNHIISLLLDHLLKTRTGRGPICRTVATTHMLDRIARANGLQVIETPVGFKHVGKALREKGCLLGGEESGGLSILGHIPEKDGILASLLLAELLAYSGKTLGFLLEKLASEYGKMVSKRIDITIKTGIAEILERLAHYHPKTIAGIKVDGSNTLDGYKYILEDGSWVLIRASGTEPVMRIYIETVDTEQLKNMEKELLEVLEKIGTS